MAREIRLKADYILPISSPLIPDGVITIKDNIIEDVSPYASSTSNKLQDNIIDLGRSVLMPGFVNCHTHLELCMLKGTLKYNGNFAQWLEDLVEAKSGWNEKDYVTSTKQGIAELLNTGTTTVADITNTGHSVEPILNSGLRSIVYKEVIRFDPEKSEKVFKENVDFIESLPQHPLIRYGLSPHAPYSVSGKLLEKIAIYSAHSGIPITIHISESEEEVQFLKEGSSALRGFLKKRGAVPHSWQPVGTTPVSYLHGINFLSPKTLGVHLNYLTDGDISILNKINMPIVHCPRSTRYFNRPPYGTFPSPIPLYKSVMSHSTGRFNLTIGTDSLASNGSLNMLDEMRLLKETFNIPADTILKIATINGAKALGLDDKIGTLEAGKCADIIALRKVKDSTSFPAIEKLSESLLTDTWEVSLVIVDGKILKS